MGSKKKPSSVKKTFEQAKSRKRRMKGKGGPENASCTYMGVRQRKWGKWVAEIREPANGHRIWLGTYQDAKSAAISYDVAATKLYGANAKLNFPEMYVISEVSSENFTTTLPSAPLPAVTVEQLPNTTTMVCMRFLFPEPPTFHLCDQSGGFSFYWNYNFPEKPHTTVTGGGDHQIAWNYNFPEKPQTTITDGGDHQIAWNYNFSDKPHTTITDGGGDHQNAWNYNFPEKPQTTITDGGDHQIVWNYNFSEKPHTTITDGGGDHQIADAQSYNTFSTNAGVNDNTFSTNDGINDNENTVVDHLAECLSKIRAWNAEIPQVDHTELWAQDEEEILINSFIMKRLDNFCAIDGDNIMG